MDAVAGMLMICMYLRLSSFVYVSVCMCAVPTCCLIRKLAAMLDNCDVYTGTKGVLASFTTTNIALAIT
jgi:hypothetical protein